MPFQSLPLHDIRVDSAFWSPIQLNASSTTIPAIVKAQKEWNHWECLTWNRGHNVTPHQFWDSDIYKVLEAACYSLSLAPDSGLSAVVEEAVTMIRNAQWPDGYINSYYTVTGIEGRWTNLRDNHELYCMGHLLEAIVAYETLVASGRLLVVAHRLCQHLENTFGTEPGKKRGYPGHEEIEIGLARFYEFSKNPIALKLLRYFIHERGARDENGETYFDLEARTRGGDPADFMGAEFKPWFTHPRDYAYQQADTPLKDAEQPVGHAVRAMYLYTAATNMLYISSQDSEEDGEIEVALRRIWKCLVDSKLYVSGSVGSVKQSEGFASPYHLPDLEDEGCYAETCASVGLINWCAQLLRRELRAEYANVMETALYNTILGSMSVEADSFYYQNPLRTRAGQAKERSKWFGVACCPPNVARLLTSLGKYVCSYDDSSNTIAVHQYIGFQAHISATGNMVSLKASLPWTGEISVQSSQDCRCAIRVPSWTANWVCSQPYELCSGYLELDLRQGEPVTLNFPIQAHKLYMSPYTGRDEMCVVRGPLLYCAEQVDNPHLDIDNIHMSDTVVQTGDLISIGDMKNIPTLQMPCKRTLLEESTSLYASHPRTLSRESQNVVMIPFFLRQNRGGMGAMRVWAPRLQS